MSTKASIKMNSAFVPTLSLRSSTFYTRPHSVSPTVPGPNVTTALFSSRRPGRRFRAPGGGSGGSIGGGSRPGSGGSGPGGLGSNGGGGSGRSGAGGGGLSGGNNPFQSAYSWYGAQLAKSPLVTKALTSFIGFTVATILATDGGDDAIAKAIKVGAMGALVHGIGGGWYYGKSEALIPGADAVAVVGKTVLDFLVFLPLIGVSFVLTEGLLRGDSIGDSMDGAKNSWKIPPPIWVMVCIRLLFLLFGHSSFTV